MVKKNMVHLQTDMISGTEAVLKKWNLIEGIKEVEWREIGSKWDEYSSFLISGRIDLKKYRELILPFIEKLKKCAVFFEEDEIAFKHFLEHTCISKRDAKELFEHEKEHALIMRQKSLGFTYGAIKLHDGRMIPFVMPLSCSDHLPNAETFHTISASVSVLSEDDKISAEYWDKHRMDLLRKNTRNQEKTLK